MGLTSAPATESIMGAVSRRQAGVGSAVNDSTRLLGGTLGVAVIGSIYASLYGTRLTASLPVALPGRAAAVAHQSVGAALAVSRGLAATGHRALGTAVQHAASGAFLHGLSIGCVVAGSVAAAGAVGRGVPARPAAGGRGRPRRGRGRGPARRAHAVTRDRLVQVGAAGIWIPVC